MAENKRSASSSLLWLEMLSYLSLPESTYLSAFLTEAHQYLDSASNSYCVLDKKLRPASIYDEINHHSLSDAAVRCLNKHQGNSLQNIFHSDHVITSHKEWYQHSLTRLYREIFFPHGYHQSLILPLKSLGKESGLLIFNRHRNQAPFNNKEVKKAKSIRDKLNLGFQQNGEPDKHLTTGFRSGLIIVDHRGEMTQCCQEGHNLLAMALQRKQGNLDHISFSDVRNMPGLIELVGRLLDADSQETNAELTINSYWGSFKINGFPVVDEQGKRSPKVYLNITWQVPFSLMLFHNIRYMRFTPKQEMIGLLYAYGMSTKAIANKLELSLYTVKEHVQHIFVRLQIHSRAELIENIICQKTTNAGSNAFRAGSFAQD